MTEPVAERSVWPGIMTWTGLPLPAGVLAANCAVSEPDVVGLEADPAPGVSDDGVPPDDAVLTETMRGAARTTCCAGIGSVLFV